MKKTALSLVFGFIALGLVGCSSHEHTTHVNAAGKPVTEARADVLNRMSDSTKILGELTSAPDQGIPETVLKDAKCVAIVPDMVKGGFVIGAQHGRGVATCRTSNGWSAPAFFTLTGGSWGAQIGAESVDLVMLVMNDQGMQQLLSANWKLGGEGSVAAGPAGRDDSANVRQDDDSTKAFYEKDYDFRTLLAGNVQPPAQAHDFLASVRRNFREA